MPPKRRANVSKSSISSKAASASPPAVDVKKEGGQEGKTADSAISIVDVSPFFAPNSRRRRRRRAHPLPQAPPSWSAYAARVLLMAVLRAVPRVALRVAPRPKPRPASSCQRLR